MFRDKGMGRRVRHGKSLLSIGRLPSSSGRRQPAPVTGNTGAAGAAGPALFGEPPGTGVGPVSGRNPPPGPVLPLEWPIPLRRSGPVEDPDSHPNPCPQDMKARRLLSFGVLGLLLAGAAHACIEALDLNRMVQRADTAVHGTITNVRSVAYTPPGDDRLIYTLITVEGEDLYTGEARTLEAAFLGGTWQGESMTVTCMPAPSEYRLGNDVVVFSAPVEGWGPEIDRCVYAAMGGIFRVIPSRKGEVVLGKGEGFAIEQNQTLDQLRQGIRVALAAKKQGQSEK